MRRIIVSGAGGFLGTNIIKKAIEENIEVIGITTKPERLADIQCIKTDEFLEKGFSFCDEEVFVNCLFPTNADGYRMAAGLEKVYRVIRKAYRSGVKAFINISSQSVYSSKRTEPAKEEDPLCLETPYAVGKYSSEEYTNQVFGDIPHTNIRMASLLGVGYDQRIVNRMVDQALEGKKLKVLGGMQRYGFLDVRDAATGLVRLANSNPKMWKETYNLGRKESYSLLDVVGCIVIEMKNQLGMETKYTVIDGEDNRNSAIDPSHFMYDFDWRPTISLTQTTADIINSKRSKVGN